MQSQIIKKSGIGIHVSYGHTFSNNLYAYNSTIIYEPKFAIHFDLTNNLRKRNKSSNQYMDARELADGDISSLTLFQINDEAVIKEIIRSLRITSSDPSSIKLRIELCQIYEFQTRLELESAGPNRTLNFHVAAGR